MDYKNRVVQGEVEVRTEGVNILNAARVGHSDREATMRHIEDVAERGYIQPTEAEARIKAAQNAEKRAELNSLTADLPAPFHKPNLIQSWDWDKTSCWLPTLLSGLGVSGVLAILPTAVLAQEHLFPHDVSALSFGVITMILGIIGFFSCIVGIICKAD